MPDAARCLAIALLPLLAAACSEPAGRSAPGDAGTKGTGAAVAEPDLATVPVLDLEAKVPEPRAPEPTAPE